MFRSAAFKLRNLEDTAPILARAASNLEGLEDSATTDLLFSSM